MPIHGWSSPFVQRSPICGVRDATHCERTSLRLARGCFIFLFFFLGGGALEMVRSDTTFLGLHFLIHKKGDRDIGWLVLTSSKSLHPSSSLWMLSASKHESFFSSPPGTSPDAGTWTSQTQRDFGNKGRELCAPILRPLGNFRRKRLREHVGAGDTAKGVIVGLFPWCGGWHLHLYPHLVPGWMILEEFSAGSKSHS